MIKNKLKPHSMGVLTRTHNSLFRPIPIAYEPTMRSRWVLTVSSEQGLQRFYIRMDGGIHLSTQIEDISYMNPSTYFIGRQSWDPIKFKIIDTIDGNPDYFREWMMPHAEMLTGRMAYASDTKRNITLEKIDPTGITIESWNLYGALITEMRHEVVMDRDMSDMEITINFDRAVYNL